MIVEIRYTNGRDFKVLIDFNIIFSVITKIIVKFAFNLNSLTINIKLYNE